jgi:hypothetical protein
MRDEFVLESRAFGILYFLRERFWIVLPAG